MRALFLQHAYLHEARGFDTLSVTETGSLPDVDAPLPDFWGGGFAIIQLNTKCSHCAIKNVFSYLPFSD